MEGCVNTAWLRHAIDEIIRESQVIPGESFRLDSHIPEAQLDRNRSQLVIPSGSVLTPSHCRGGKSGTLRSLPMATDPTGTNRDHPGKPEGFVEVV